MNITKVALIYNDKPRPETTGFYCRRALGQLVDVEHFLPSELDRIPENGFDLYLNIDDGLEYRLPRKLRPCAWWAIDTHINPTWYLEKGCDFDFVFAAQRDGAEYLRAHGISSVAWLPLACDPDIHRPCDGIAKQHDLCFVGNVLDGPRADLLELLRKRYPNTFVGQRYFDEMAKTYAASRIVFNRSVGNDVNMRVFEALSCGAFLLTNNLRENGQEEHFQDGIHLATYADPEELLYRVGHYLAQESLRDRIAAAGRNEAVAHHTYRRRMQQLLTEFDALPISAPVNNDGECMALPNVLATADNSVAASTPTIECEIEGAGANRCQNSGYFSFSRPELVALIPSSATRVLEIGCGAGRLGESLKKRQAVEVVGIELVPAAATEAARRLDQVLVGDVETMQLPFEDDSFDVIVCGDVLEHLREPDRLLQRARNWLRPGGRLISSIPNVRNHSVVRSLLEGNWTYEPAGLLDRTHLRFFTRREIEKLFFRAGYRIESIQTVPDPFYDDWHRSGQHGEVRIGRLQIGPMDPEEAEQFYVYQYLTVAIPDTKQQFPLTSIVIVTHNQLAFTHQCVESIRFVTDEPYELIFVDNGSTDGTVEYLRSQSNTRVIANPQNRGYPAAANQGLQAATGSQILLLNNDVVVATGWLRRLLTALYSQPDIGLVGPCSNNAPAPQKIEATYDDLSGMDGFAWEWAKQRDGNRLVTESLGGFCMLVRREVVERIGLLDERFGLGTMEDDDFCLRARRAGFRAAVAQDSFIHHIGHQTFRGAGIDFDKLHQKNLELFRSKWEKEDGLPPGSLDFGRTSIIIVTHNQLEFTRQCVESVRRYTNEPYELIFVDNASTDGTVEFLKSISNSTLIANPVNRGFPAAVNQGIQAATGNQILLLNNDCVVPKKWLGRLLSTLCRDPKIGLVGPCSNCVSGEQQVSATYSNLDGLNEFTESWAKSNSGRIVDMDRLVGFCLLIRKELIDKLGGFDEQFGIGCFEDDDYCLRAVHAGYRAVIAREAFVHHYGGRTFVGAGVDFEAVMERNRERFQLKWGNGSQPTSRSPVPSNDTVAADNSYSLRIGPRGGLFLSPKRIRLSLCMIVRDNSRTIEPCLRSIRPWVDEMIVVDTGSKDNTPEIVAKFGARLFHFPWCDSFSAARNESLRHVRGEWIFWMDSDDTITEECGRKLRDLADSNHEASVHGYVMQVHCPGPNDDGADVTVVDHVKMFRNLPQLRFEGRIHEQIIPSIRRAGGEIAWTDLYVVHSGYDHSSEGQEAKKKRDLHLLSLELHEQPNHPFTLFNLGMTYADLDQHEEAVRFLERSLTNSGSGESHLRKVYALLVHSYQALGKREKAWDTCKQGLDIFPRDAELLFRKAALLHDGGRLAEAEDAYRRLLAAREERHYSSVVRGIQTFLARQNLAAVYSEMGMWQKAEEELRLVVEEAPNFRDGWRGLGEILLKQNKYKEATAVAHQLMRDRALRPEGRILNCRMAKQRGALAAARKELEAAVREFPQDPQVTHAWCQFMFESGDPLDAEKPLLELVNQNPNDASVHHNLGTVYLHSGRASDAVSAYESSLQFRPDCPATYLNLGYAHQAKGDLPHAKEAWLEVVRLVPDSAEASEARACLQGI